MKLIMEENKKPNNPFAFPAMHSIDGNWVTEPKEQFNGMTLRDYFAGLAMQGYMSSESGAMVYVSYQHIKSLCEHFYKIADAMLKQRELC